VALHADEGAADWFELDLNDLALRDDQYEYEVVLDGAEDTPLADPYAHAITRFKGYRGVFDVVDGQVVDQPFRWDEEFPNGMLLAQNNKLVIYEMPVRWMTGEDTGDGFPGIRQVGLGTFDRIRFDHIDTIVKLGANYIELMPIQDSPDTLNWGYGTRFFFAPDLGMGTPVDLKCLIKYCHQVGIRVLLDIVMNHSRECPLERLAHDWYYLRPSEEPARRGWGGERFRYAQQTPGGTWAARDFHCQMAEFWIREYRVDGFRIDDFADINNWDFVRAFREHAWTVQRRLYPDRPFIVIAEDSQRKTIITQSQPEVVDAE
jgi:1,4-alpha-glucan branching enzyme